MRLRIHESENLEKKERRPAPSRLPRISVNARSGVVVINPAAMTHFGWTEGICLAFAEDEDHPGDWYVIPNRGHRKIFAIAPKIRPESKSFQIKSKRLATDLLRSIGMEGVSCYIPFGEPQDPDETGSLCIPLLTRKATPVRRPATKPKPADAASV